MEKPNLRENSLVKTLLVLAILFAGVFSALSQLYIPQRTAITSSEPQVLAASTSEPLGNVVSTMRVPKITVSTVSATPVQVSDFEVKLPVLTYHRIRDLLLITDRSDIEFSVSPKSLEEQLQFLANEKYQTISLSDLSASFENKTPLPAKAVMLTFDDGFRDFYTNAFPLLKKYNMRAVCFYVAGYSSFPGYLDLAMLRELHESGLVDIQSHTMSHLLLPSLSVDEQRREIFQSKTVLESALGKKINYFAYPYGGFDQNTVNLVAEAGYKLGFGTTPGLILKESQSLTLPRISVSGFDNLKSFGQKLGVDLDTGNNSTQEELSNPNKKESTTSSTSANQ